MSTPTTPQVLFKNYYLYVQYYLSQNSAYDGNIYCNFSPDPKWQNMVIFSWYNDRVNQPNNATLLTYTQEQAQSMMTSSDIWFS